MSRQGVAAFEPNVMVSVVARWKSGLTDCNGFNDYARDVAGINFDLNDSQSHDQAKKSVLSHSRIGFEERLLHLMP